MRETRTDDGCLLIETEMHGALLDDLEGVGLLSPLPGVVDVPNPGSGWSVLEADRIAVLRRLSQLDWGLVDPEGEYWEDGQPFNDPVMVGTSYVLARTS